MEFKAKVYIMPKIGILDPQGKAVLRALVESLGYDEVRDVRIGRLTELTLESPNVETARKRAEGMCRDLLVNPVMEDFRIKLIELKEDT